MKAVKFFSMFAVLCNVAFLAFMFMGKVERKASSPTTPDQLVNLPFFKDIVITLGMCAILVNLILCIVYAVLVVIGKQHLIPKWLAILNFLFFIFQLYYFFFR